MDYDLSAGGDVLLHSADGAVLVSEGFTGISPTTCRLRRSLSWLKSR